MLLPQIEVQVPLVCKGSGALTRSFLLYPITITTETIANRTVSRRYTDFEALRDRLKLNYWFCIIPALPEKETALENIGIIESADYQECVGKMRQKEFKHFLNHIFSHPEIRSDPLVLRFFDDEEWRKVLQETFVPLPFLDTNSVSAWAQSLFKKVKYLKEHSHDQVEIDIQRKHLDMLRSSLQQEITHRRGAVAALTKFALEFESLKTSETSASLKESFLPFEIISKQVADYHNCCSNEEEELLTGLNYWYNMCCAVLEMMKNVSAASSYYGHIIQHIANLKQSPSKASSDISTVENLRNAEKERDALEPLIKNAEKKYKEQIDGFRKLMTEELNLFLVRYHKTQKKQTKALQLATAATDSPF